jgi:hypothetical protein
MFPNECSVYLPQLLKQPVFAQSSGHGPALEI